MRDPSETKTRQLGVLVAVAALGFAIAAYASRNTHVGRLTNLALPGGFDQVYVQFKIGDPTRCLVTDRGGATADRAAPELSPARWYCLQENEKGEGGKKGGSLLALDGKRASFLFVPYEQVADPVYPLLYEAVRPTAGPHALPRLRWVHLYVDRTYRGFYLQTTLPTRDFFEDKQLGELELLVIDGDHNFCFDRKLRGLCPTFTGLVALSQFPQPAYTPETAALAALLPEDLPRAFLLSDQEGPEALRAWPLPFGFPRLVLAEAKPYFDHRYESWRPAPGAAAEAAGPAASEPAKVAADLHAALAAACQVRRCDAAALGERIDRSPSLASLKASLPGASGRKAP